MAKRKFDLVGTVTWIVGLLVSIGVGGLFINGTMEGVVLLNYLPPIVHDIVGWIIVIGAVLGAVLSFSK
jgi:hypothetical protein